MELFTNAAVAWFIVGFMFFILEFIVPGLILFFFGVGSWAVALLCFFIDVPFNVQLVIFLATSVLSISLFRKWIKKIMWSRKHSSEIEDEFIGKTGKAETFIAPGQHGKVNFKGTSWNAKSEEVIESGETVTIVGNESILLIVRPTKTVA